MQTMDSSRTEERIDDLRQEMHAEFKDVHAEFKDVRAEMRTEFKNVRAEMGTEFKNLRAEMKDGFDQIHGRFDSLQRSMLWMMGTMLVVVASILAAARF